VVYNKLEHHFEGSTWYYNSRHGMVDVNFDRSNLVIWVNFFKTKLDVADLPTTVSTAFDRKTSTRAG